MKIYDCFSFFNEFDLLEIRLQELWDTVDYFVISEANMSHSGKPKEYLFENNKARFEKYMSKIRHIKVDDMPETKDSWVRERFQRKACERGLYDLDSQDIVIVSDADEIPRAEIIKMIKEDTSGWDRYILYLPMFQFRLNFMKIHEINKGINIIVTRGSVFTNPQQEREYTFSWVQTPQDTVFLEHGGWHFSYFGDDAHAVTKIKNFAHVETDVPRFTENMNIDLLIKNKCGLWGPAEFEKEKFEWVAVDDYFPKCVTENLGRWQDMIIPGAVLRVTDLYREDK